MKLNLEPLVGLCDENMNICISEMSPFGKVKVSASMFLPWAENAKFESFAWFTADSEGNVDLSKQKPDSGTYDFIDPMGLIGSMKLIAGKLNDIVKNITTKNSLFIDIVAECEKDRTSGKLERLFRIPEVKTLKITDEFVGELFYPENANKITIVAVGGSDGSLDALSLLAAPLASHGFNVLSVAYFNAKGLPKKLAEVPIDCFESVFQWLKENPITSGNEIYFHGTSKGGELSLLLASRYPDIIKKVVAFAPHAYCFQGLNFKNVSSWTYKGESIPYIRLKTHILFGNILNCFIKNKPFGYAYTYRAGLAVATNKEAARIKIENSNADLLLIAGEKGNMWNDYDGCLELMDTLTKHHYKHSYELLSYKDGGHPFPLPYIIPVGLTICMKLAPRLVLSTGGTLQGNAYLQADSWHKTIEFFKR